MRVQAVELQDNEWLQVKAFRKRHPEAGSLNFIYQMAKAGELLSIKLGGRVLIRSDALDHLYKQRLEPAQANAQESETPTSAPIPNAEVARLKREGQK